MNIEVFEELLSIVEPLIQRKSTKFTFSSGSSELNVHYNLLKLNNEERRWPGRDVFKFHYTDPQTLFATRPDTRTKSVHVEIEQTSPRPDKVGRLVEHPSGPDETLSKISHKVWSGSCSVDL